MMWVIALINSLLELKVQPYLSKQYEFDEERMNLAKRF